MDARPLNYAPRIPYIQRRALHRTALVFVTACLLAWAGCKWGPRSWEHAKILYWQRAVMRYSAPPDQLVYDSGSERVRALVKSRAFDELTGSYGEEAAIRIAPAWANFEELVLPDEIGPHATLFAHGLRNSRGDLRLVSIAGGSPESVENGGPISAIIKFQVIVLRPGTWASMPLELTPLNYSHRLKLPLAAPIKHIQWFAGQSDPADESHFTIAYCIDGKSGLVDGWLRDDNGVALEPRR